MPIIKLKKWKEKSLPCKTYEIDKNDMAKWGLKYLLFRKNPYLRKKIKKYNHAIKNSAFIFVTDSFSIYWIKKSSEKNFFKK